MKKLSTLFLLLALSLSLRAQWTSQASGHTRNIRGIWAINATTAVAVGSQGGCWRTTNGGTTWPAVSTGGITSNLNSVKFLTATAGMAVGDGQDILTTSNGGTSWTSIGGGITDLHDGALLSGSNGWVVGKQEVGFGFLYNPFTFDLRQPPAAANKEIRGIWANSATSAWIVGDGGLVMMTTTGSSWAAQTSNTTAQLNKVAFNGRTGLAVGNGGVIIRTTNDGADWAVVPSNTTQNLLGVCFADAQNAYAVGASGTIRHSTDGGATWASESLIITSNLNAVHGAGGSVWAVGNDGTILKRTGAVASKPLAAGLFSAFPNPATDRLTVNAGSEIRGYSICNLLGERRMKGESAGKTAQIDLTALKPGFYMLEVETAAGSQVRKFRKI